MKGSSSRAPVFSIGLDHKTSRGEEAEAGLTISFHLLINHTRQRRGVKHKNYNKEDEKGPCEKDGMHF